MSEAEGVREGRLQWVDLAKGGCIVLVVAVHVHTLYYLEQPWAGSLPVVEAWTRVHDLLWPVRMPVFFAISGVLAASALQRPWRRVAIRRVASPYYLYVLWLVIHATVYGALQTNYFEAVRIDSVGEFAKRLVVPVNSLWYVYALAGYFLLARLLRRIPTWVALAGAAVVSAAAYPMATWFPPPGMLISVQINFVYFLVGAFLPAAVKGAATWARGRRLVIAATGFAAVVGIYTLGWDRLPGIDLLAGLVAIWFGIAAAEAASHAARVRRLGTYLGRNTLPIYVLHGPLIGLVVWLTDRVGHPLNASGLQSDLVAAVFPVLMTAGIVAASLFVHRLLVAVRLGWLFRFPAVTAPRSRLSPMPADAEVTPALNPER